MLHGSLLSASKQYIIISQWPLLRENIYVLAQMQTLTVCRFGSCGHCLTHPVHVPSAQGMVCLSGLCQKPNSVSIQSGLQLMVLLSLEGRHLIQMVHIPSEFAFGPEHEYLVDINFIQKQILR